MAARTFPKGACGMISAPVEDPSALRHAFPKFGYIRSASSSTTRSRLPVAIITGSLVMDFCGLRIPPMASSSSSFLTSGTAGLSEVVMVGARFVPKISSRGGAACKRRSATRTLFQRPALV